MDWPGSPVLLPDVPRATYEADDFGDVPTLRRSVAHALISLSPAHAYAMHPRLGGNAAAKESKAMDSGSLVHALLLGGEEGIEVLPAKYDSFRTDAARAIRDGAREEGRTPILHGDYQEACAVAYTLSDTTRGIIGADWPQVHREATVLWEEPNGSAPDHYDPERYPVSVRCRARLDILHEGTIWDVKVVTKGPAQPEAFIRRAVQEGLDIQAASYVRGVEAVHHELAGRVRFGFLLCELEPPHDVVPVLAGKSLVALGASKWERACRLWARCLESGEWPGRSGERLTAEAPEWALVEESTKGGL